MSLESNEFNEKYFQQQQQSVQNQQQSVHSSLYPHQHHQVTSTTTSSSTSANINTCTGLGVDVTSTSGSLTAAPCSPSSSSSSVVAQHLQNTSTLASTNLSLTSLYRCNLITVDRLQKYMLHKLFNMAHDLKTLVLTEKDLTWMLRGKVMAEMFYEPSTRTQCSFTAAAQRLGGSVIYMDQQHSSVKKGETLEDSVRMMSGYADLVVIRHPELLEDARRHSGHVAQVSNVIYLYVCYIWGFDWCFFFPNVSVFTFWV